MLHLSSEEAFRKYCCRPNALRGSTCTGATCMAWVEEFELVETNEPVHKLAPPKTKQVKTGKGHCGLVYR